MQKSTCEIGGAIAMYLGDAPPPPLGDATAAPTAAPTTASETHLASGGGDLCYRVTVSGSPGVAVNVQPTDSCPANGQTAPADDGRAPPADDGTPVPTDPEGDPANQDPASGS